LPWQLSEHKLHLGAEAFLAASLCTPQCFDWGVPLPRRHQYFLWFARTGVGDLRLSRAPFRAEC
jgi:hypothetical protein